MGHKEVKYTDFNRFFFKDVQGAITWYDRKGVYHVGHTILAEITLSTRGTRDHYVGYNVRIVTKAGEITQHFFNFNTYLKNRCDDRTDDDGKFEIIATCCNDGIAEWYIAVPTEDDTKKMGEEIKNFISHYGELENND